MKYESWLAEREKSPATRSIKPKRIHSMLHEWQRMLVTWALSRGRAALFADTGLGKTFMQIEWARSVYEDDGSVLIVAPLAVAQQTIGEGDKLGVKIEYNRDGDITCPITITNYEHFEKFDINLLSGVVLDESSILKSFTGKYRTMLIDRCKNVPFRLACTATPAPNDHMELGNHSEFLGLKTRSEMLAEYFIHDAAKTQDWRLKGHAKDAFWRWVCSWAAMMRKPSDIGFPDDGYILPPLNESVIEIAVDHSTAMESGLLFLEAARGLADQRAIRKSTADERARLIAAQVNQSKESCLVWCEYNHESALVAGMIPDAIEVTGSMDHKKKIDALMGFADGRYRVLVTKPKIAGFGMNWQHCNEVYFFGPSHSYEQVYQAIRRCWRFGQSRPVSVKTCVAETESVVVRNYQRKAKEADEMSQKMIKYLKHASYSQVDAMKREWNEYQPEKEMRLPRWAS